MKTSWNEEKTIHERMNRCGFLYADSINVSIAIYFNFVKYFLTLDSFG